MEIWDAYDKDFNKIPDVTLIRDEEIPSGMFHLVCDVIVKHTDGSYLLMQREINARHMAVCGKPQQVVRHCKTKRL